MISLPVGSIPLVPVPECLINLHNLTNIICIIYTNIICIICRIKDWPKWLLYSLAGHGKRLKPEGRRYFTMDNLGKKAILSNLLSYIKHIQNIVFD